MSGGVFICYRREDSAGFARLMYDRLTKRLGPESVFLDVTNIPPGQDFVEVLSESIGKVAALLVVIGRSWADSAGLENPSDFVRIEIEAALGRDVRVIPVLVDGAAMPKAAELPDSLKGLARRQGIEISHTRFDSDFERLEKALSFVENEKPKREQCDPVRATREEREARGRANAERERVLDAAQADIRPVGSLRSKRYYVSYAWADSSDPNLEDDVDRLCEFGRNRGITVLRDKTTLHHGDLISDFMKDLGSGDRIFVFLSNKYLKSPYCMFELSEIWRNSRQTKSEFLRNVRVFTIGVVKIDRAADRLRYTEDWNMEREGLRELINRMGWERWA